MARVGHIVLIRHGQTAWSATGRHTSTTDVELTPVGEGQARDIGRALAGRTFMAVLSSPRLRALRTAELAGLGPPVVDHDLAEWDYGEYEGITSAEIWTSRPDWSLWTEGAPGGESPEHVGERVDRLLTRVRAMLDSGDIALVGHGHSLRVVAARWVGWPVPGGAVLGLDTGTVSELGFEHERSVIRHWNVPATPVSP